jgi:hypothetical protein
MANTELVSSTFVDSTLGQEAHLLVFLRDGRLPRESAATAATATATAVIVIEPIEKI